MREAFNVLQTCFILRNDFEHTFRGMRRSVPLRDLPALRVRSADKSDGCHFECSRLHISIQKIGNWTKAHLKSEIRNFRLDSLREEAGVTGRSLPLQIQFKISDFGFEMG